MDTGSELAHTLGIPAPATNQNRYQLDGGNNGDDLAGTNTTYTPGNGYSGSSATGVNLFADPLAVYNQFRRPVLGQDTNSGVGVLASLGCAVTQIFGYGANVR